MMRNKIFVLVGILGMIAIAWVYFHGGKAVQYTTVKVTRGSITNVVEATGTLNPVGNTTVEAATGTVTGGVTVGAQVNGRIMKVNVGFNSHVKKGQVLAEIDPTTYQSDVDSAQADLWNAQAAISTVQANLAKARAGIANAQAQLAKDQANLLNVRKTYERDKVLVEKHYIAQSDLDTAQAAYEAASAQINSDRALIQSAQEDARAVQKQVDSAGATAKSREAALHKAQTNLSYTKILAPVDGIVVASNAAVGQTVVSSFQSPSLFVIAKSLKTMQIDTLVDEADVPKIKAGQTAKFNIDSYPTETFTGTVAQIRNNPITQQNVVNYDVIVYSPNPGEKFLPGMTANVNFVVAKHLGVLQIPNRALLFVPPQSAIGTRPASADNQSSSSGSGHLGGHRKAVSPQVWVLVKNRPELRKVTLGISDGSVTEVVNGLSEGEEVITGTGAQKTKANQFSVF